MRRSLANRFPRLVTALMVVAAMLSSGGLAKYAHLWSAHSHAACATEARTCASERTACAAHASVARCDGASREHDSGTDEPRGAGSCGVCAELACLTPEPPIASPWTTVLEVLALVHDRAASQRAEPDAPRACAARPPPSIA